MQLPLEATEDVAFVQLRMAIDPFWVRVDDAEQVHPRSPRNLVAFARTGERVPRVISPHPL